MKTIHLVWKSVKNIILLSVGSFFCALAVNGILIPKGFASSGITGLSLIAYKIFPAIDLSVIYIGLNIPLFIVAYSHVGRRFFTYSLIGMIIFSFSLSVLQVEIPVHDNILAAMLAGILGGTGAGIMLRSMGSAGGADILSVILLQRYSIRLGSTVLALNIIVLILALWVFSLEAVLYTVIVIYVSSQLLNLVVTGFSQRKAVMIISEKWQELNREILTDLHKGVTVIPAKGGYSGKDENILYAVINFRQVGHIKRVIKEIDPNAFVVVTDTMEVINYRIGNQPHW